MSDTIFMSRKILDWIVSIHYICANYQLLQHSNRKKIFAFAVAAALCGISVSCGSDDDDPNGPDGGNGGPSAGPVVPSQSPSNFGGVRLMSVLDDEYGYGSRFTYDAAGLIKTVTDDSNETYIVDFATGTVTYREYNEEEIWHITNTDSGLITSVSSTLTEHEESGVVITDVTWNFSYDSSGHLIEAVYEERGRGNSDWMKGSTTLTWSNGLLLSAYGTYSEVYEGESDSWTNNITFEYDNAYPNAFCQYTDEVISAIDLDGGIEPFMFVGVLGIGPNKYPTKIIDNDSQEYSDVQYSLNAQGLVKSEIGTSHYGGGYSYSSSVTYTYSDESAAQNRPAVAPSKAKKHISFRKQRPSSRK